MREILFRGKRKDNGEWVKGRLLADSAIVPTGQQFVVEGNKIFGCDLVVYDVIPETVGQYTGLTDKNGKKIFEGDILEYIDSDDETQYASVVFENYAFLIEEDGIVDSDSLTSNVCLGIKVASNIHDNSELAKGATK